jgi:NADPH:quinone reductase-like Zn-dependent oxidoreductase
LEVGGPTTMKQVSIDISLRSHYLLTKCPL